MSLNFPFFASNIDVASIVRYINVSILFYITVNRLEVFGIQGFANLVCNHRLFLLRIGEYKFLYMSSVFLHNLPLHGDNKLMFKTIAGI